MVDLATSVESKMLECFGMDNHDEKIRADERVKTLDELETKLQCWDKGANAIPNYVWKCIRDMKGGAENGKL